MSYEIFMNIASYGLCIALGWALHVAHEIIEGYYDDETE